MEKLIYSIADLSICIEMPFHLDISSESNRFLKPGEFDYVEHIKLIPADVLPPLSDCGIWHQDRYYAAGEAGEVFHIRSGPGKAPYAMIEYGKEDGIRISYLRDSKDLILQSRYLINMMGLEILLLRHGGLILHSSFIRWQGQGILFSAPSGTGKSTQAGLWETHMGAEILNGDRAGIRYVNGTWRAYGLPYAGSSHIFHNESAPIRTIVVLRQGPENRICPMSVPAALRALLPEFSAHRWNSSFMDKVLDLAAGLLKEVPVYTLEGRPDDGAVQLLHDTLLKEGSL